jgi:hypothetical protein
MDRPEVIVPGQQSDPQLQPQQQHEPEQAISQPGKLLRIASMIRELVEEVRRSKLDDQGRTRLARIYRNSLEQLKETLSEDLQEELAALAVPLEGEASEAEVRVAQAQLLGWLEGLFHGIQAALYAQHMQAQAALDQMRRRQLPSGPGGGPGPDGPESGPAGQYL